MVVGLACCEAREVLKETNNKEKRITLIDLNLIHELNILYKWKS